VDAYQAFALQNALAVLTQNKVYEFLGQGRTGGLVDKQKRSGKFVFFGFDRLPDLLREKNYSSLELTLNSVMIELNKFKENSPFNDDIIIIGIEVR